jgi:hypothetical protein
MLIQEVSFLLIPVFCYSIQTKTANESNATPEKVHQSLTLKDHFSYRIRVIVLNFFEEKISG